MLFRSISRLWGNNFDNQTFWTGDIAASYGIELYPIHGGSLYLGHNQNYANRLWNEIKQNTGILNNEANDNLGNDVMWEYAAVTDAAEALTMYDSYPNRSIKFGVTDVQTYYWLHAMNVLGMVDATVTADYPIAAVFNRSGRVTYVAHNYGITPRAVTFSDGYVLNVPAGELIAQGVGVMLPSVAITAPKNNTKVLVGDVCTVTASAIDFSGETITGVEFYANNVLIGSSTTAPYSIQWSVPQGSYALVAKATNSSGFVGESSTVTVVGATESSCDVSSNESSQGTFSNGSSLSFVSVGTTVYLTS